MEVINKMGVDKICVSSSKALFYDFFEGNRDVIKATNDFPGRVLGYVTVNPLFGEDAEREFENCIKARGMIGLKLHTQCHKYPADDPSVFPVVEKAVKLKVPILIHARVDEFESLADHFQEAVLILAHMGNGGGEWMRGIWSAKKHENVILETCSSNVDAGRVKRAVEAIGAERIIYGTDIPWLDPFTQMAKVKTAEITEEAKRLILGENMAQILRLSENQRGPRKG